MKEKLLKKAEPLLNKYNRLCTICVDFVEKHRIIAWFLSSANLAVFYGIFLSLYWIAVLREIVPVIHPVLIAWAGVIAVYDMFIRRIWRKIKYSKLLFLFIIATVITTLINLNTGIVINVKTFVMTVLPLVAFYPVCYTGKTADVKRLFIKAFSGAAVVVFLASAISVALYLLNVSQTVVYDGISNTIGYRYYQPNDPTSGLILFGVYKDTNHAAAYAVCFSLYSVYLLFNCKQGFFKNKKIKTLVKVFAILNLIAQVCYFPVANSRGGWLCLIVTGIITVFAWWFFKKRPEKKQVRRVLSSVLAAVIVTLSVSCVLYGTREVLSFASHTVDSYIGSDGSGNPDDSPTPDDDTSTPPVQNPSQDSLDSFSKNDDDMGSGRISIWKDTIKLFVNKPVFGTGVGNNKYYAGKYGVATYTLATGKAVHNSYLDLLLDYGAVGFILLMLFFVLSAITVLGAVFKRKKILSADYFLVFATAIFVAGCSFFLSCTFIGTSAMYFILLISFGYIVAQAHGDDTDISSELPVCGDNAENGCDSNVTCQQ